MGRFDTARDALNKIDGGKFQELCLRYLSFKYKYLSLHNYGASPGTTVAIKGHPDSFLVPSLGDSFVYVECGHVLNKSGAKEKLREDARECHECEIAHPDVAIEKIVLCYCARLAPEDVNLIRSLDDRGRIELLGPDELADACVTRCPWLGRDYLGIKESTGAILDVDSFRGSCRANPFCPDMDQSLIGRRDEADELSRLVESHSAVLVSGPSGCGKTKLCLEVASRLAAERSVDLYVIKPCRDRLREELIDTGICSKVTYLILDDANNLSSIQDVIDLAQSNPRIRIIATVRNTYRDEVSNALKQIKGYRELELTNLGNADVDEMLEKELGVANPLVRERIAGIAKGNLRIACLASEVMRNGGNGSIDTVVDVFECSFRAELDSMTYEEKDALAVASLLGPHRVEGNQILDTLLTKFGLTKDAYLSSCRHFHDRELMSMLPGMKAISFDEQSLRDYFLRYSLIGSHRVELADMCGFRNGLGYAASLCRRLVEVFSDEETLDSLSRQAREVLRRTSRGRRLDVVCAFGTMLRQDGIAAIAESIHRMSADNTCGSVSCTNLVSLVKESGHGSFKSMQLSALSPYISSKTFHDCAVAIVFSMLEKGLIPYEDYTELFTYRLASGVFFDESWESRAHGMLDELIRRGPDDGGETVTACLILFTRGLLLDRVSTTRVVGEHSFRESWFTLGYSEKLVALRRKALGLCARLCGDSRWSDPICEVALRYKGTLGGDRRLSEATYEAVASLILPHADLCTFEKCARQAEFVRAAEASGVDISLQSLDIAPSQAQRLAIKICDIKPFDSGSLDSAVDHALDMTNADWEEFFSLLGEGQTTSYIYQLYETLEAFVRCGESSADSKLLVARLTVQSINPLGYEARDAFVEYYVNVFGTDSGRERIRQHAGARRAAWLALYDAYLLSENLTCDCDKIFKSIDTDGELIPFVSVCGAERVSPGFIPRYVSSMIRYLYNHTCPYPSYIPYGIEKFERAVGDIGNNADACYAIARLLCTLLSLGCGLPSGEVIARVLEMCPDALPDLIEAYLLSDKGEDAVDELSDALTLRYDISSLLDAMGRASNNSGCDTLSFSWRWLDLAEAILRRADEAGRIADAANWVALRVSTEDGDCAEKFMELIPYFDYSYRRGICLKLADYQIGEEAFLKAVLMERMTCSWEGSSIPGLEEDLSYLKGLQQDLFANSKLMPYALLLGDAIERAEQEIRAAEVREFLGPLRTRISMA